MRTKKDQLNFSYFISFFFIVIILMPLLGFFAGINRLFPLQENRTLTARPKFSREKFDDFTKDYSNYFSDNFGLRPLLVSINSLIRFIVFKSSINPQVLLGKNNQFFYTTEDTYLDSINGHPFSETELESIKNGLEEVTKHFQTENIPIYFFIAPNPQSIISEDIPDYLPKLNNTSRLQQIDDYLQKNHAKVVFIDPSLNLYRAKKLGRLYYQYDTHWNELGAFIGYTTYIKEIAKDFPEIKPLTLEDFTISYQRSVHNDLALLNGLGGFLSGDEPLLQPNISITSKQDTTKCPDPFKSCPVLMIDSSTHNNLKLVSFHDSFLIHQIPLLSTHFKHAVYIWKVKPLSSDVVAKEKPDLILYEMTERELWRLKKPLFDFQMHNP